MISRRLLAVGAAVAALTAACAAPPSTDGDLVDIAAVLDGPGRYAVGIETAGIQRQTTIVIPENAQSPAPLVIALHGLGGSSRGIEDRSGMTTIAEREGFVVAYPQGIGWIASWRVDPAVGPADVVFLRDLVESIAASADIDTDAVFVVGNSNGGGMAARFACEEPEMVTAIALVSAAHSPEGCVPADAVATIAFHGTADLVVPLEGREPITGSIVEWAEQRVAGNGCEAAYTSETISPDVIALIWAGGCRAGATVVLHLIDGAGHIWPNERAGAGRETLGINGSEAIWSFFAETGGR